MRHLPSLIALFALVACGSSTDDAPVTASTGSAGNAGSAGKASGGAGSAGKASGGAGSAGKASGGAGSGQAGKAGGDTGGAPSAGSAGTQTAGSAGLSGVGGGAGAGLAGGAAGSAGAASAGKAGSVSLGGSSSAGAAGAASGGFAGATTGGSAPFTSVVAPPPDPAAPVASGVPTVTWAMSKLALGGDPPDTYKFADNLDGKQYTDPLDASHCQPRPGAKKKDVVIDGPLGEDNSFAKNIMPIVFGLAPDAAFTANDAIKSGDASFVIRARNLGPATAQNGLSVDSLMVRGVPSANGYLPVVDFGTYAWRPLPDLLTGSSGAGDALVAKFPSASAYLAGDVLVASGIQQTRVDLGLSGQSLGLVILDARIIAALSADHTSIESGRVAGIIPYKSLSEGFRQVAGKISASLCAGTTIDNVLAQVEAAADIMVGAQQDPSVMCDGISVGLGIQAVKSTVGVAAPPDPQGPCGG